MGSSSGVQTWPQVWIKQGEMTRFLRQGYRRMGGSRVLIVLVQCWSDVTDTNSFPLQVKVHVTRMDLREVFHPSLTQDRRSIPLIVEVLAHWSFYLVVVYHPFVSGAEGCPVSV